MEKKENIAELRCNVNPPIWRSMIENPFEDMATEMCFFRMLLKTPSTKHVSNERVLIEKGNEMDSHTYIRKRQLKFLMIIVLGNWY